MKIILKPEQAKELAFDQNKLLVRSCFYLGMGTSEIKPLVTGGPFYQAERQYMIETAALLGMKDHDEVVVDESQT